MEEFELEPGEEIIVSVRTHIFVLAMRLLPFLLMAFVPWIALSLLSVFDAFSPQAAGAVGGLGLPAHLSRFFTGLWLLLTWTGAFSVFTQYYLTVWVITNLRIVDIKQKGFFNRVVSSFMLTRVQDVTTDTSGIIATLVHFGRLSVETAGKDEDFAMNGIAEPEAIRDIIMRQVAIAHQANPGYDGL
jgi:hypothetical protein